MGVIVIAIVGDIFIVVVVVFFYVTVFVFVFVIIKNIPSAYLLGLVHPLGLHTLLLWPVPQVGWGLLVPLDFLQVPDDLSKFRGVV